MTKYGSCKSFHEISNIFVKIVGNQSVVYTYVLKCHFTANATYGTVYIKK